VWRSKSSAASGLDVRDHKKLAADLRSPYMPIHLMWLSGSCSSFHFSIAGFMNRYTKAFRSAGRPAGFTMTEALRY
jgi:hypothetical protein